MYDRKVLTGISIPIYTSLISKNLSIPSQRTHLLQIPYLQRLHLKRITRKIRAKFIHFANFFARSSRDVFIEILHSRLLVTRLCTSDLTEQVDPLRPREPLACCHERGVWWEFEERLGPGAGVFGGVDVWDENVGGGGELHLDGAVGLLRRVSTLL